MARKQRFHLLILRLKLMVFICGKLYLKYTVLGLDIKTWRLLAVEFLRLDRAIISARCLEGITAIKDVILDGVCSTDTRQYFDDFVRQTSEKPT